jgi:hypothetical protein
MILGPHSKGPLKAPVGPLSIHIYLCKDVKYIAKLNIKGIYMIFQVQGSEAVPYVVKVSLSPLTISCSCMAAMNGLPCKHRIGILSGKDPGIVSGDKSKLVEINSAAMNTDIFDRLQNYDNAKHAKAEIEKQAEKLFKSYLDARVRLALQEVKTDRSVIKTRQELEETIDKVAPAEVIIHEALAKVREVFIIK